MKKLYPYLKPYKFIVITTLILVFLQTIAELFLPALMSSIVDVGVVNGDIPYIWKIGGLMIGVAIIGMGCAILASYFAAKSATGFGRDLRESVFTHVENFSQEEFDRIGTASMITRTTNDIMQVQNVLMISLRVLATAPLMAIGGITMAILTDVNLSLVFVFSMPILAITIFLIARKGIPLFKQIQKKLDKLNQVVREKLMGVSVIRSFNRVDYEEKRYDKANKDLMETLIKVNKLMAAMMPLMMLIINLTTIAIVWFAGHQINAGNMQVGELMAFIQYAMFIMFSLMMASMMFVLIPRAQVSAVRIGEILDMEATIKEAEQPTVASEKTGVVEFQNVSFYYPGAEMPAISNISFKASPGKVTAIIGGTGSGKSTLVQLIPRFYEATSGAVLVDGVDVREWQLEALRNKIGYVPQKAILFTGTIEENMRFGNENATMEQIQHAVAIAQAEDFINEKNEGIQTEITQGGANLSGGQKQRLSIARAIVRKPDIYIFDDSFSALDFKTDANLRKALRAETEDKTVIMIAQRVGTVMDADQIIVLDNGKIAGIGTHKELLKTNSVYQEIVSSQMKEEELE